MHQLVLLRHAKSSWAGDLADEDRPLSSRGRRDADAAGEWLRANGPTPDLVLCSVAERTRETWDRAAASGGLGRVDVRYVDAIYQAWPDTLLTLVQRLPETVTTALLVGHAPGLPDLAARLNQVSGTGPLDAFPTCTLVVFGIAAPWAQTGPDTASLSAYAVPRG